MTSFREMRLDDLFKLNPLVFDYFTEVYSLPFFVKHLIQWSGQSQVAESPNGQIKGYIFGKTVTNCPKTHGHICALTVAQDYRRLGVGTCLMNHFSKFVDQQGACYVNLLLRCSNIAAYELYRRLGYIHRRTLLDYYPDAVPENAFDMLKPLSRDLQKPSLILAVIHSQTEPKITETEQQI
ncbi:N-alpha-acetyltransferase 20 [Drosophila tropicalis]|uniref:N-alpha-acetyltransferase 20 n=1 Tax=Drosophila tropicalis TaxID=46794 RepID=UPI0035AB937D